MKAILFSLLILSYSGIADSKAQQKNNEEIEAAVFGLLKLKNAYQDQISRKSTKSSEEYKTIVAAELDKSEYGKSLKTMKDNPSKYLVYIEKAISTDAERLSKETINYQKNPVWSSAAPDQYVISKLDYLKAVKYSLFDQKSDELLHLYEIPGIKLKYGKPNSSGIKPH